MTEIAEIVAATAESLDAGTDETTTDTSDEVTDASAGDEGATETDEATEPEAPTEPEPAPASEAPTTDDDLKALEKELTAKNPKLAKGRIPVSRHQAVLERQRRQAQTELDAKLADLKKNYEPYESNEFRAKMQALTLAETDHRRFFSDVLMKTPAYQALVEDLVKERLQTTAPAPKVDDTPEEPPKPDYLFPDGVTLGYTAEGQQKLFEYQRRQAVREATKAADAQIAEIKAQVAQTLSPIVTAQQAQRNLAQAKERVAPVYQLAQRWPGFKDHEEDIRVEMNKPTYDGLSAQQALERAYDAVVPARLKVAEETRLAEQKAAWVKEMNDKAKARTVPAPGGLPSASSSGEPRSIADIVADTARRMSA